MSGRLSGIVLERIKVFLVFGIDVEHMLPGCPCPFGGHRHKAEHKGLDAACGPEPEAFRVNGAHKRPVEIVYQGREEQEHCVLRHKRLGKPIPSETIVHVIEDSLLPSPEVVVPDNLLRGGVVVVCEDAAVCVFPLPELGLAVPAPLPLDDKPVRLPLPLLNQYGVELELVPVDLHRLPAPEEGQAVIQRGAVVGADIEAPAVLLNDTDNVLGAGPAVGPETVYVYLRRLKPGEHPRERVLLVEAHIRVAVAVLNADDYIPYDGHSGTVPPEFLVRHLCVIFLRLKELMVEVQVVHLSATKLSRCDKRVEQQFVGLVGRVEVVDITRLGGVADVALRKFDHGPQYGVGAAGAQSRMD